METDLRDLYAGLFLAAMVQASHNKHALDHAAAAGTAADLAETLGRELERRDAEAATVRDVDATPASDAPSTGDTPPAAEEPPVSSAPGPDGAGAPVEGVAAP